MSRTGDIGTRTGVRPSPLRQPAMSRKAMDLARNFVSALFMGVRTAQIHDASNRAFENAVQTVHRAAEALFAATNGFSLQFVEDSVFMNGIRMRFDGGLYESVRTLRNILESKDLGGIELKSHPTYPAVQKLLSMFASAKVDITKEDLVRDQIGVLGVQRFADGSRNTKVDRRVFAVQCYAKLILALNEQLERLNRDRASDWAVVSAPPRLRAVRVIQDLIELCGDRADFLLRLATNETGAMPIALHGANVCVLSLALGHAIGFQRQEIVDLGVAALFHHIGAEPDANGHFVLSTGAAFASVARILRESGVGASSYARACAVGELGSSLRGGSKLEPHPYTRVLTVASTYAMLVTGFGIESRAKIHPINVLARMANDRSGHLDARVVDLLINVLRAFPVGSRVLLDSGQIAEVVSHDGGSRWDRPMVRSLDGSPRNIDLMVRDGGRFNARIVGTVQFVGHDGETGAPLIEIPLPVMRNSAELSTILEGADVIPDELPEESLHELATLPDDAFLEVPTLDPLEPETLRNPVRNFAPDTDPVLSIPSFDAEGIPAELPEDALSPLTPIPIALPPDALQILPVPKARPASISAVPIGEDVSWASLVGDDDGSHERD